MTILSRAPLAVTMAALVLAGCASQPPAPQPPMPARLPGATIESLCGLLHGEGMMSEVRAIKTTQSLINSATLQALAHVSLSSASAPISPEIVTAPPMPVEIPPDSCIERGIDAFSPARDADVMVLSLSSPFSNPFARGQYGVLARLSLGNDAGVTWYWIPIAERGGHWLAGRPIMLSVH